jgi:hypothetical protein
MAGLTNKQLTLIRETPEEWTPYVFDKEPGKKPLKTFNSVEKMGFIEKTQIDGVLLIRRTEAGSQASHKKKLLDPSSSAKVCPTCGIEKDKETGFGKNRSTRDGYQSCCLICSRAATARWKEKSDNKSKIRATKAAWRKANPESAKQSVRKCWDKNHDRYKVTGWRHWIKTRYGLTEEQYYEILERQNFGCAICGKAEADSKRKRFCVDHCHDTNVVRGLLCFGCNVSLGNMNDRIDLLEKAIGYLKKFPKTGMKCVTMDQKEKTDVSCA